MATGDITAVTIRADGFSADVTIEGWSAKSVSSYAEGTLPSSGNFKITVTSEGYNTSGTLGTVSRTVSGTRVMRKAYPNEADFDETVSGSDLIVRIALTDHIYNDDKSGGAGTSGTDPSVVITSGYITAGDASTTNAHAGLTCTNSSTVDYPVVKGGWLTPAGTRIGSIYDGAVCVKHPFGQSKPCVAVKFTITDETANTVSELVTTPSVRTSVRNSSLPKIEQYEASLSTSGLVHGEVGTVRFQAYPFVGDADSILDSDNFTFVTDREGSQPHRLDLTGAYREVFVYVSTTGDNSTGVASTTAATAKATPYLDMWNAIKGARDYINTNYSESNNLDGAVCRFMAEASGNYDFFWGRSGFASAMASDGAFVRCEPDPAAIGTPRFTTKGSSAGNILCQKVRIKDMTVTPSGSTSNFFAGSGALDYYQFEGNELTHSGTGSVIIQSDVEQAAWFDNKSIDFIADMKGDIDIHSERVNCEATTNVNDKMFVGFDFDTTSDYNNLDVISLSTNASPFIAYGRCATDAKPFFSPAYDLSNTYVGHIVAVRHTSATEPLLSSEDNDETDVHFEHISGFGARFNHHNDTTPNNSFVNVFVQGVSFPYQATKHDVFGTDGTLIGGWSVSNGVNYRYCYNGRGDTFPFDYDGVGIIEINTGTNTDPDVVDNNSFLGDNDGTTFGDYTPTSGSDLAGNLFLSASAYDLNGNPINSEIGAVQIAVSSGIPIFRRRIEARAA